MPSFNMDSEIELRFLWQALYQVNYFPNPAFLQLLNKSLLACL